MVLEVRPTWVLRRVLRFSSALFAEWLVEAVLHDVPHRRVVLTVSKALRGLTERERDLHGLVARSAWEALPEALACAACEPGGLAGAVISLQTFGSYANFHPVIWPEAGALEESVRRCFLDALEQGAAEPGPAARETISCSSRPRLERRSRLAI